MTEQEAIAFLEEANAHGSRLGLSALSTLLDELNRPERCLKFIHIAGTNGKGSTCAFTASILKAAGLNVGLFTSPYIMTQEEQIKVNGNSIAPKDFRRHLGHIKEAVERIKRAKKIGPTSFEIIVALSFLYFKESDCDIVVLEVGLGGLTDATNVIETPLIAAFTPISIDHSQYLGHTLKEIAQIKSGIIKPEGITLTGEQAPEVLKVLREACDANHNTFLKVNQSLVTLEVGDRDRLEIKYQHFRMSLGLIAPYQVENARLAVAIIETLISAYRYPITHNMIRKGLSETTWPARFECLSKEPVTIVDGAHNVRGVEVLCESLTCHYPKEHYRLIGIIGMLADKEVEKMLAIAEKQFEGFIVTESLNERTMSASELAGYVKALNPEKLIAIYPAVSDAVDYVKETFQDQKNVLVYFGSLYYLGKVKSLYL
jgi:dihydrofolate synthase/folylpolyglutamate synthase